MCAAPDQRCSLSYPLPTPTPAERALQAPLLPKPASCLEPPIKTQLMLSHSDPDTTWYFSEWCGGHSSGPWGPPSIRPLLLPGQMLYLVIIPILQLSLISPLSCYSYSVYIVALYTPPLQRRSAPSWTNIYLPTNSSGRRRLWTSASYRSSAHVAL